MQRGGFLAKQRHGRFVLGQFRQHQLDGDGVAGLDRVALVDLAHAAGRNDLVDLIDAVQRVPGGTRAVTR